MRPILPGHDPPSQLLRTVSNFPLQQLEQELIAMTLEEFFKTLPEDDQAFIQDEAKRRQKPLSDILLELLQRAIGEARGGV